MTKSLRVGIIGVSIDRGWAKDSHVPALQKLAGVELAAVATSHQATASAAAKAFGAKAAYGDATDLFRDPSIDLVAVCVKVPAHLTLVLGALAAGKHVYCEWPLGRDIDEAEQMRDAAAAAGVHVAIGLQTRMNPAFRRARELVASGAIGRVLSAHIYSGTAAFGRKVSAVALYHEDAANGATHLTIHGGHAMDAAVALLGGLADTAVLASIQYPEIEIEGQSGEHRRSIPDHILAQSHLQKSGVMSAEIVGGRPPDTTFRFEVVGDRGLLALDGGNRRGFQAGRLILSLDGNPQSVDEGELAQLPDSACNTGGMYAALRDDIARGM